MNGSSPTISNCTISNSSASGAGGAVFCNNNSSPIITDCVIQSNRCNQEGGGILCRNNSAPTIQNSTITLNSAKIGSGGIFCDNASPMIGSVSGRGNIFSGNRGPDAADIASLQIPGVRINASWNTFAGYVLSDYYVSPSAAFNLSDCISQLAPILTDVYVSPTGDDSNDGLSPSQPFRTIQHALSVVYGTSLSPITVHLAEGTYSGSGSGEIFPLPMVNYVSILGAGSEFSILDTEDMASGLWCSYDGILTVSDLKLTGGRGSGIYCSYSSPIIDRMVIDDFENNANGSGLFCHNASPTITNTVFSNNSAYSNGGAIYCRNSSAPTIHQCTITGNSCGNGGAGVFCIGNSHAILTNNHFIGNRTEGSGGAIYIDGAYPVIGGSSGAGNYFANNSSAIGADISSRVLQPSVVNATYNTFSGYHLSDYYVSAQEAFNLANCVSETTPITQDVYVATTGLDTNDGLTPASPFRTIQHALKSVYASISNPITIHIASGTFSSSLTGEVFPLPLINYVTLSGSDDGTVLNANPANYAMKGSYDTHSVIENVQFTGSRRSAVDLFNSASTFSNCSFSNIYASTNGAGISCNNSAPTITHCTFSGNSSSQFGGGVHCGTNSPAMIQNCTFSNNISLRGGGGIQCGYNSTATIENCTFTSNSSDDFGGAVYCLFGSPLIRDSQFINNKANDTGGAICCDSAVPVIGGVSGRGNRFENNRSGDGTDLASRQIPASPIIATYNTFAGYHLSDYYVSHVRSFDLSGCISESTPLQQDVYVSTSGDDTHDGLTWDTAFKTIQHAASCVVGTETQPVTIHIAPGTYSISATGEQFPIPLVSYVKIQGDIADSTILNAQNTSDIFSGSFDIAPTITHLTLTGARGSAIRSYYSSPTITHCTITGNNAISNGSGILCESSTVWIEQCDINSNRASSNGGGIYANTNSDVSIYQCDISGNSSGEDGGAVFSLSSQMRIDHCSLIDNTAKSGGGLFSRYNTSTTLSHSIISANTAQDGGGIYGLNTDLLLYNCLIDSNSVREPRQVETYGGGIYCSGSTIDIQSCTVTQNESVGFSRILGGGIYMTTNSDVTITDSIFWENQALQGIEIWLGSPITPSSLSIDYSDVQGGLDDVVVGNGCVVTWGDHMLDSDPLFVTADAGDYCLSQESAGQESSSPCIDSGSVLAEEQCMELLGDEQCMDTWSTRTDSIPDSGQLDIGYHYPAVQCIHSGDVDANLTLSAGDAQSAFIIAMGAVVPTFDEACAADCDGNNEITAGDAQGIFGAALGMGSCMDGIPGISLSSRASEQSIQRMANEDISRIDPDLLPDQLLAITSQECEDGLLCVEIRVVRSTSEIDAFTMSLQYDSQAVQYLGCKRSDITMNWLDVGCNTPDDDSIIVAGYTIDEELLWELSDSGDGRGGVSDRSELLFSRDGKGLIELYFTLLENPQTHSDWTQMITIEKLQDDLKTFVLAE